MLQLTLDFFDSAPAAPPQEPTARKRRAPDTTPRPPAISQPTELLDQVLLPVAFRHPRANREAVLGDSVVAFEFRRGKRRNIGFMVGPEGLTVSAPKWVPLYEIDAAVQEQGNRGSSASWATRTSGSGASNRPASSGRTAPPSPSSASR